MGRKDLLVAEHNSHCFISIDNTKLNIGSEAMLGKVSVVCSNLKAIRAPDFHQRLISSLSRDSMDNLLRQLFIVSWSYKVGIVKGLSTSRGRYMTYT